MSTSMPPLGFTRYDGTDCYTFSDIGRYESSGLALPEHSKIPIDYWRAFYEGAVADETRPDPGMYRHNDTALAEYLSLNNLLWWTSAGGEVQFRYVEPLKGYPTRTTKVVADILTCLYKEVRINRSNMDTLLGMYEVGIPGLSFRKAGTIEALEQLVWMQLEELSNEWRRGHSASTRPAIAIQRVMLWLRSKSEDEARMVRKLSVMANDARAYYHDKSGTESVGFLDVFEELLRREEAKESTTIITKIPSICAETYDGWHVEELIPASASGLMSNRAKMHEDWASNLSSHGKSQGLEKGNASIQARQSETEETKEETYVTSWEEISERLKGV